MSDNFEDTERLNGDPDEGLSVDAVRLWSGGLGAAIVAALAALVSTLVARVVFQIGLSAPHKAAAFDGTYTVRLCVVAAVAALAATGLVNLLLLSTPRPLAYFGWIVGLLTAAAAVTPFLAGGTLAVQLATAVMRLVIGLAVGGLVSTAAAAAARTRSRR
jgi:hypothetical protein